MEFRYLNRYSFRCNISNLGLYFQFFWLASFLCSCVSCRPLVAQYHAAWAPSPVYPVSQTGMHRHRQHPRGCMCDAQAARCNIIYPHACISPGRASARPDKLLPCSPIPHVRSGVVPCRLQDQCPARHDHHPVD